MKEFNSTDVQGGSGDGYYSYFCDSCKCYLSETDHGINRNCLQCQVEQLQAELNKIKTDGWRSCIDHIIRPDSPCPVCKIEQLQADNKRLTLDVADNIEYRDEAVINLDRAEKAESENVLLRDSLKQLVNLKQFKDMYGKNVEYMEGKPLAWRLALRTLSSTPQTAKIQAVLDAAKELNATYRYCPTNFLDQILPNLSIEEINIIEAVRAMEE